MLRSKVCLVTGASKGIGRSIALEFSKNGYFVIIHYNKDEKGAMETERLIKKASGHCNLIKSDLSTRVGCKSLIESAISKAGKVDILINNAGISKNNPFIFTSEEDIENLINTNINSFLYTSYYTSKHMVTKKQGVIINIGSIWGEVGASNEVVYSLTKGAMHSFTKSLGKELGPSGIRVLAIVPGIVDTSMNKDLTEDEKFDLMDSIPLGRFASTSEIAEFAVFLASPSASYANAKVFIVDGGFI
ncbi:MAG: SDR family oxidoreductase [Oscillospiraceae bacterium]|nr:SDR family oxidoreductase [Oscillospiraceae bacterium]